MMALVRRARREVPGTRRFHSARPAPGTRGSATTTIRLARSWMPTIRPCQGITRPRWIPTISVHPVPYAGAAHVGDIAAGTGAGPAGCARTGLAAPLTRPKCGYDGGADRGVRERTGRPKKCGEADPGAHSACFPPPWTETTGGATPQRWCRRRHRSPIKPGGSTCLRDPRCSLGRCG